MKLFGFGERFKQLRLKRKLTQTQMGEIVSLHYTQVARLEKGHYAPSTLTLVLTARKFKVNMDWLVFGEKSQSYLGDEELRYLFKQALTLSPADRIELKKLVGDFVQDRKTATNSSIQA